MNIFYVQKSNNGVLMMNFWSQVMRCDKDWKKADMDDLIDQIEHVKGLIGVDHIGMGADYDGVGDVPLGLEDVSTYPNLFARILQRPGWTIEDIKKIAGLNILRVMRDVESIRDDLKGRKEDDETLDFEDVLEKFNVTACATLEDHSKNVIEA